MINNTLTNLINHIKSMINTFYHQTYSQEYINRKFSERWNKHKKSKGKIPYVAFNPYEMTDITYTFTDDGFNVHVKLKPGVRSQFFKKLKKAYIAEELSQ